MREREGMMPDEGKEEEERRRESWVEPSGVE